MKKLILSAVVLLSMSVNAQNPVHLPADHNGVPLQNDGKQAIVPYNQISILSTYEYENVRALTEINSLNSGEGYPWISPDGLNLYYTQQSKFAFTKRTNTNSYFNFPSLVPVTIIPGEYPLSCWLSDDELDIYYIVQNALLNPNTYPLYYAHRNNAGDAFGARDTINLAGISVPFITGVSLNHAQDELFSYTAKDSIIQYSRSSPISFNYVRAFQAPPGYKFGPGQLSKNGLTYLLGVSYNNSKPSLYQLTRATPADTFSVATLQQIKGINDTSMYNSQPSMSNEMEWVVFVRSDKNLWNSNDLYIAHKKSEITSVFDPYDLSVSVSVFPNPANELLFITCSDYRNLTAEIFNIKGLLIKSIILQSEKTEMQIDDLKSGLYLLKIQSPHGIIAKKIVKD